MTGDDKTAILGYLSVASMAITAAALLAIGYIVQHAQVEYHRHMNEVARLTGGDPVRGREVIERSHCGDCHEISGMVGARGQVGPSLRSVSSRFFSAFDGHAVMSNLIGQIRGHDSIRTNGALSVAELSYADARDAAAFLLTTE